MVPALLKWIGNKQRFAEYIVDCFPESFRNYHEPFLGSGAVLAELSQRNACGAMWPRFERAYASDALPFLVDIFQYVKDDPDVLCDYYQSQIDDYYSHPDESYSMIRDRFNSDKNCLDFCLLTRTCYSGIVRFRKKDGFMSTPKGSGTNRFPPNRSESAYISGTTLFKMLISIPLIIVRRCHAPRKAIWSIAIRLIRILNPLFTERRIFPSMVFGML